MYTHTCTYEWTHSDADTHRGKQAKEGDKQDSNHRKKYVRGGWCV